MVIAAADGADIAWTEGDVDIDGVRIHYYRTGNAGSRPLVLAHGLGDSGRCWDSVVRVLLADFDIVAIDSRNHGKSATAGGGAAELVLDVEGVLNKLELESPVLMGHSLGARTLANFAAERPGDAAALVLEDPPWDASRELDGRLSARRIARRGKVLAGLAKKSETELLAVARREHPEWNEREYPAWIVAKQQARPEAAKSLDSPGWAGIPAALRCPTLLIHGDPEFGGLVTPGIARRIAASNSAVTVQQIDGAAHNIRRENFDQYIAVVRSFLADY